ncbi:ABC transporter permease [Actinokineospora sp. G85]|uniref:ABC transporter permease n=1 Tax=Actinokineospora sp. G85 TaxID=3406626 RepID=UPI003C76A972
MITDSRILVGRCLRHLLRNPEQLVTTVALPLILLLTFRYLFGGAIDGGTGTYANYIVPGLFTLAIAFNATTTTVAVVTDLREGIVERFRSMPMAAPAVLVGHVVAALVRNLLSVAVIVGLGLVVGFRPTAGVGEWLAALGVLSLLIVAISWASVVFGLVSGSVEAATGLSLILVFLPYTSTAMVPAHTLPAALRVVVEQHPVTAVIETVRGLVLDTPIGRHWWVALLWWCGLVAVLVPLAAVLFRRRGAR